MTVTTLLVVIIGVALAQGPITRSLGFAPLPLMYFAFLLAVVGTYLVIVEIVKRRVMRRLLSGSRARKIQ